MFHNVFIYYKIIEVLLSLVTLYEAEADDELVELRGEGGEEAGEAGDEAAGDRGEARGLVAAEGDRGRGQHQRHRRAQRGQPAWHTGLG